MKYSRVSIRSGDSILIPEPESYKDCILLIKSDDYRVKGKQRKFIEIIKKIFVPYSNTFLIWFRLCQYHVFFYPLCKLMRDRNARIHHLQISSSMKVGYGFYIGHGCDIIINPFTIIGNNVNLSNFTNIGTNKDRAAIIGNDVYIGPHVSIVGDVKLGSASTVGAGSVVTKDVLEGDTVAGVPAKVIHHDNPGRFINRKWIFD